MSKQAKTIAIVNQKGGVGKTTTTINLAAALSLRGKSVLIVDIDPQGNASTGLGVDRSQREKTIYDILVDGIALEDVVLGTTVPGLSLIPSHVDLAAAELEIGQVSGRTTRLREALSRSSKKWDYILIDCPPSLNLLTVNALAAANSVIVPLQCEFYALEGLSQLLQTVEMAKANITHTPSRKRRDIIKSKIMSNNKPPSSQDDKASEKTSAKKNKSDKVEEGQRGKQVFGKKDRGLGRGLSKLRLDLLKMRISHVV